jgi:hypothetical protein
MTTAATVSPSQHDTSRPSISTLIVLRSSFALTLLNKIIPLARAGHHGNDSDAERAKRHPWQGIIGSSGSRANVKGMRVYREKL